MKIIANSHRFLIKISIALNLVMGLLWSPSAYLLEIPLSIFPLQNYEQNIEKWINPNDNNYKKPLVDKSYQEKRFEDLKNHYFVTGKNSLSPWDENYVNQVFGKSPSIKEHEQKLLERFNNDNKSPEELGYGINYRPLDKEWIERITHNISLDAFENPLKYKSQQRAILVQNTYARSLPTLEPHFYNIEIAGQGYPFDNLQMSALWAGTPIYIVGETKDKLWVLILTPDVLAWVPKSTVAKVNNNFVEEWQQKAQKKLAAIIKTETPVQDIQMKMVQFNAYIGSIFPVASESKNEIKIMIPVKDAKGNAAIKEALLNSEEAAIIPLAATPENFSKLFKTLHNRPYGWGGMYFYNDCSAELKSLMIPFGIWLPRHSSDQTSMGRMVDKSQESIEDRLKYLTQNGHPLMTLIYNGGHTMLYVGNVNSSNFNISNENVNSNINSSNKNNINKNETNILVPLVYQNVWGLKPKDKSYRAVIGKSLFLPLLSSYPEDKNLNSQAGQDDFKIIFLDEWPSENDEKQKLSHILFY